MHLLVMRSLVLETLPNHQDFRPDENQYKRLREVMPVNARIVLACSC